MKVTVILNSISNDNFADVKLAFQDINDTYRTVDLNISFQNLYDFSEDTTSVQFDFFFISALVYGIDNLLERYQYSIDGWARDIEVSLPVNNLTMWSNNSSDIESILSFLTGDYWSIHFEQIPKVTLFKRRSNRRKSKIPIFNHSNYSFVSLFSGGLDSLVGTIDGLNSLQNSQKGLLISHFDSSSPGANSDQLKINKYLSSKKDFFNKYDWIQTIVTLSNHDNHGLALEKESSYRSRSLLFISMAIYCAEKISSCNKLTIPENGTISLNYPLTPSRTSTLSTRTTHPYYLTLLQSLITQLGLKTVLYNPYSNTTKGELVEQCISPQILKETYRLSVSCGKRGRKMHWDTKSGTQHCGICMPCLYRRAALHKLNLDDQLYGIDIFNTPQSIFEKHDFPALFDFLNSKLTEEQIKRNLLISGSLSFSEIDESAKLVIKVMQEVRTWINDKGDDSLKKLIKINQI